MSNTSEIKCLEMRTFFVLVTLLLSTGRTSDFVVPEKMNITPSYFSLKYEGTELLFVEETDFF